MKKRVARIDPIRLPDTDKDFPVGSATGFYRYSQFEELAEGGVASIQQCMDLNLNRVVAMKRLHEHLESDKMEQRRFLREARVTAQIQHPNTVPVYEIGRDKMGLLYFTMKKVEGVDLREIIGALNEHDTEAVAEYPLDILIEVFRQTCLAIAFAHSRGVIHRDLKPANVLVGPFNEVVVLDWGLAKVHGEEEEPDLTADPHLQMQRQTHSSQPLELTQAGRRYGTPLYMSPEQARGDANIDERTDVYNLGIILYEILTLKNVVWGTDLKQVLEDIQHQMPPPPSKAAPRRSIPPELEAICMHCLEKKAEDRYPSVNALIDDVQAWSRERPVSVLQDTFGHRIWKWRKRHLLSTTSLVAFIAGILLTLLVMAASGATPDPDWLEAPATPPATALSAPEWQSPSHLPRLAAPVIATAPADAVRKQPLPPVARPRRQTTDPLISVIQAVDRELAHQETVWRKRPPTLEELAEWVHFAGPHARTGGLLLREEDTLPPAIAQRAAARALWQHATLPRIHQALSHPDAAVRWWAVSLLTTRNLATEQHLAPLQEDTDPRVASAARDALATRSSAARNPTETEPPSRWWPEEGVGTARLPDGSIYTGPFHKGVFEGEGALHWPNGDHYQGHFRGGALHGRGEMVYASGGRYDGQFKHGEMQGHGMLEIEDFSTYHGEFKNGLYHGEGVIEYANGNRYEGAFAHGDFEGQGKLNYNEAEYQQGTFVKGLLKGEGVMEQRGLGRYEGEFKGGVMHGKGTLVFESGDTYQGNFVDGRMEGQGDIRFTDGSRYTGEFRNDLMHGRGILSLPGGEVISGRWAEGEIADEYQID